MWARPVPRRTAACANPRRPWCRLPFSTAAADAVHDALLGRRTAGRMFDGRPVPDDVLLRAVEAATYAPNHKLTEPWRFVCLGDQSAAELGVLVADHIGGEKGLKKQQAWAAVPTWIAALCKGQTITEAHTANNQSLPSVMDYTQLEDYAAVCCAVHNMTLSMHTAGVSAKWSTGGVTRKQAFRDLIGAADDELVVGVLMCGFRRPSAPSLQAPRKLRPLTELPEAGGGGDDADADAAALPGFARRAAAAAKPVLCFSP